MKNTEVPTAGEDLPNVLHVFDKATWDIHVDGVHVECVTDIDTPAARAIYGAVVVDQWSVYRAADGRPFSVNPDGTLRRIFGG